MIVNVTITDERLINQPGRPFPPSSKTEYYERVALTLTGNAALVAGALRAIADDIAPHGEADRGELDAERWILR